MMKFAPIAILAGLIATPTFAASAPVSSAADVQASCNIGKGQLLQNLGGVSIALGQLQQQVESLTAQLAQTKKDLAAAQKSETKKSLPVKK